MQQTPRLIIDAANTSQLLPPIDFRQPIVESLQQLLILLVEDGINQRTAVFAQKRRCHDALAK